MASKDTWKRRSNESQYLSEVEDFSCYSALPGKSSKLLKKDGMQDLVTLFVFTLKNYTHHNSQTNETQQWGF